MAQEYVPPVAPPTTSGPTTAAGDAGDRSFIPNPGMRLLVGLVLLVPAAVAWWISYVKPSYWTVRSSFFDSAPIPQPGDDEYVGLDNYEVAGDALESLARAVGLAWFPLATMVIAAVLLAFAAHKSGRVGRWITRIALSLPLAAFAPVAVAAGWLLTHGLQSESRSDPALAMGFVGTAVWLTTFGLVIGAGVTMYLSAMRRREPDRSTSGALATTVGIGALATVAVALQVITMPWLLTGGGPQGSTNTPIVEIIVSGLQHFNYGVSGVHSTLLLAVLMVLGVLATLLLLLTRLRVEFDPWAASADDPEGGRVRWGALIATVLGLLLALGVAAYGLWPWLSRLGTGAPAPEQSLLANTWLPPLVSAVAGVLIAAVAGFGIGAVRPLGRWSELLLLPFAPWLFVGFGPLLIAHFEQVRAADEVNTFSGLIQPSWLVIPALFVFTVLFRGLENRRRRGPANTISAVLLPALPMVAIATGVVWVIRAQSLLWQYVTDYEATTAPMWTTRQLTTVMLAAEDFSLGVVFPVGGLALAVLALIAAQVLYLDRLAIRVGSPDTAQSASAPSSPLG